MCTPYWFAFEEEVFGLPASPNKQCRVDGYTLFGGGGDGRAGVYGSALHRGQHGRVEVILPINLMEWRQTLQHVWGNAVEWAARPSKFKNK